MDDEPIHTPKKRVTKRQMHGALVDALGERLKDAETPEKSGAGEGIVAGDAEAQLEKDEQLLVVGRLVDQGVRPLTYVARGHVS